MKGSNARVQVEEKQEASTCLREERRNRLSKRLEASGRLRREKEEQKIKREAGKQRSENTQVAKTRGQRSACWSV